MLLCTIVCACLIGQTFSIITEIQLPEDVQQCFDLSLTQTNSTQRTVSEVVYARCVHGILWNKQHTQQREKLADDAVKWIQGLVNMDSLYNGYEVTNDGIIPIQNGVNGRWKRQAATRRQPRIRREYRMLSDRERNLFHRSINMLKADTSVSPNKYDALGRLHFMSVERAHFGPNFLPWHRLILVVLENALREKIPSVTIPYWDNTADNLLLDPRSSILWTPEFLGTANGLVDSGPFANWNTPQGRLIRNFGTEGAMMNWTYINKSLRKDHLEEISTPFALPDNNFEEHHNQIHLWVGGHMAPPALAAFDPVFYILHSFADMIWEIFRGLQKRKGIDPTTDYPRNDSTFNPGQRYDDLSGFGTLRNKDALSDTFTDNIYKYERPPHCSIRRPHCGTRYLKCDTTLTQPRCIAASIFDPRPTFTASGIPMAGSSGIRELKKRSTGAKELRKNAEVNSIIQQAVNIKCDPENINKKYVNNYLINGVEDKNSWVYIPVEIVYRNKSDFNVNNKITVHDKCNLPSASDLSARAFVESNGINYNGFYKEIAHFEKNVPTSSTISFVAVRKPIVTTNTEVMISAYDVCGRICQPYCYDTIENAPRKCSGAIKLSKRAPFQYGYDVTSASNSIWREDINGLPSKVKENIFVSMVCDVHDSFWPWS